ncbi:MAG: hypothetical protein NTV89_19405, partial [Proteobacteria bacterium]|nr:hypothetical protein [Pseudomonadota bacterium]
MNLYVSLDEARAELHKRWQDKKLKHQIETDLGNNFWPQFRNKPRSLLIRFVLSPENKFIFFIKCAHYVNAAPLVFEFTGDAFIAVNDDKRGLGRCCVYSGQNAATKKLVDLIDFPSNEKRKIKEVTLKNGELLVAFHHSLLSLLHYPVDLHDMTAWFNGIGKPIEFYYPYLLHFVAHGVLFEVFFQEKREREISFTNKNVLPAINKIEQKYGLKPLIVRLYPENPTELEDF